MSEIRFQSTVMTPNGPGLVQGLLNRKDKPSALLVSHDPQQIEQLEEVSGDPVMSGQPQGIWVLFAYPPAMVKLAKKGKK